MKILVCTVFIFFQIVCAHDSIQDSDSISDGFVVSSKGLESVSAQTNKRIRLLITRLQKLNQVAPKTEREFGFLSRGELTLAQKNAAADILLEAIQISLDHAETMATCQNCAPELPRTYAKVIQSKIQETKEFVKSVQGTPFERLDFILNYMALRADLKIQDILKNVGYFFKGVGIKVGGDLAEIYGERGSVALAVVFLTWIPYTFATEAIEHSIIGPFAAFCMVSQMIYFGAIRMIFDAFANFKNTLMYRMSSKDAFEMLRDVSQIMIFEARLKYTFGVAIAKEFPNVLSQKKLKAALHMDWISRSTNILLSFKNMFFHQLYRLGLTEKYRFSELHKIRTDSFLYSLSKTHNWADIATVEAHPDRKIDFSESVESDRHLETQLLTLVQQGRKLEAYMVLKEMYALLAILRKQMTTNLRILKQTEALTMSNYNLFKSKLGLIYNRMQKLKFAAFIEISSENVTAQDIQRMMESYLGLVSLLKSHYIETAKLSQGEPRNLAEFSESIKSRSKLLYQRGFGFLGSCERYFAVR